MFFKPERFVLEHNGEYNYWIILDTNKGVNGRGQVVFMPILFTKKKRKMATKFKWEAQYYCKKFNKGELTNE